jgi:hypothetical protein
VEQVGPQSSDIRGDAANGPGKWKWGEVKQDKVGFAGTKVEVQWNPFTSCEVLWQGNLCSSASFFVLACRKWQQGAQNIKKKVWLTVAK